MPVEIGHVIMKDSVLHLILNMAIDVFVHKNMLGRDVNREGKAAIQVVIETIYRRETKTYKNQKERKND